MWQNEGTSDNAVQMIDECEFNSAVLSRGYCNTKGWTLKL